MKIFKEYLHDDDVASLVNLSKKVQRLDNLRTSYGAWNDDIVQYSSPVLIFDIPEEYTTNLRKYPELSDMSGFMLYFWPNGSYIPWHDDNHAEKTGTIYLNDVWERNWGGYLCWEDGYLIPTYNTMALQKGDWHCTTPVTKPLYQIEAYQQVKQVLRTTLQFFKLDPLKARL